ncbi:DnaK suppressor protein [Pseudoclavibacter endophyticus]|uniref:TraR/DksA family transcriptional regulator n=1 Tax=Pseudoclavibacter endophyticus TaxID=1778590 RepID=A0A6H9WPG1_9MICO|nr:TraR/DksA family transcriptional regulator [Pseudoclavibacter endophyticus]KAB1649998.1 TraR/DksA family transcriptional regulator [Pseudoclavibacter endophyticus]GGA58080.1 DnaK suppressor protein [Pseudoclavibacter endophyticus]
MTTEAPDFGRLLRERLARAEAVASQIEAQLVGLGDLRDPNTDDEHDPDGAPVSGEWSRLAGMRLDNRFERTEILAAIDRLERDAFGICEACGRPIAEARLRARPVARTCVDCAA